MARQSTLATDRTRQALPLHSNSSLTSTPMQSPFTDFAHTKHGSTTSMSSYCSSIVLDANPNWRMGQLVAPVSSQVYSNDHNRIYTDQLCIHISKLPHDTKKTELTRLLSAFGPVSDVYVKRGKDKRCSALAKYEAASDAARAIQSLHGKRMKELNLIVRYDRSEAGSTTSSAPSTVSRGSDDSDSSSSHPTARNLRTTGPLIVDGARGPNYRRRRSQGRIALASASSEDESQSTRK